MVFIAYRYLYYHMHIIMQIISSVLCVCMELYEQVNPDMIALRSPVALIL